MNKIELYDNMVKLVDNYIEDKEQSVKLIGEISSTKVKYVLSELDRLKTKEYTIEDRALIKDIVYHYG